MTRVRILLALFFIVIIRTQAFSQNKINQTISISGYVKDSLSNKSLEYPTVVLISDSMKIVSAVAGGAVQDAERSALAVHQDPSLVRPHPNSKVGRGLEWVRPGLLKV